MRRSKPGARNQGIITIESYKLTVPRTVSRMGQSVPAIQDTPSSTSEAPAQFRNRRAFIDVGPKRGNFNAPARLR